MQRLTRFCFKTSWGSRADADTNDEQRLAPVPQPSVFMKVPPGNGSLVRYNVRQKGRQTPAGTRDACAWAKRGCASYDSSTSYMPIRVPLALFTDAQEHARIHGSELS